MQPTKPSRNSALPILHLYYKSILEWTGLGVTATGAESYLLISDGRPGSRSSGDQETQYFTNHLTLLEYLSILFQNIEFITNINFGWLFTWINSSDYWYKTTLVLVKHKWVSTRQMNFWRAFCKDLSLINNPDTIRD